MYSRRKPHVSNHDLSLIGNIVVDDVYGVQGWPKEGTSNRLLWHRRSIGGLGNIIEALPDLRIFVDATVGYDPEGEAVAEYLKDRGVEARLRKSDDKTSRAVILSDLGANERTSFVDWGCGAAPLRVSPKADWAHISYLDVSRAAIVGPKKPIVSADLCLSEPNRHLRECLGNVDFLFVSKAEASAYAPGKSSSQAAKELCALGARTVVLHERHQTILMSDHGETVVPNQSEELKEVDVLGAGDIYCASFIRCMIKGSNPETAAGQAHERTFEMLKKRQ